MIKDADPFCLGKEALQYLEFFSRVNIQGGAGNEIGRGGKVFYQSAGPGVEHIGEDNRDAGRKFFPELGGAAPQGQDDVRFFLKSQLSDFFFRLPVATQYIFVDGKFQAHFQQLLGESLKRLPVRFEIPAQQDTSSKAFAMGMSRRGKDGESDE